MRKNIYILIELNRKVPEYIKSTINYIKSYDKNSYIIFITNKMHKKIQNVDYIYLTSVDEEIEKKLELDYPLQFDQKNKFWTSSTMRLFMLEKAINNLKINKFIHIESDALSFIDTNFFEFLVNYSEIPMTTVNSNGKCVPTCIVIGDAQKYLNFISQCRNWIINSSIKPSFFWTDQLLLSKGYQSDLIGEIPSKFEESLKFDNRNILFDTAYVGGYLFGKDPSHNNFIAKSGFIYDQYYENTIKSNTWGIRQNTENNFLITLNIRNKEFTWATIHNYAKKSLNIPKPDDKKWSRIISEANLEKKRRVKIEYKIFFHILYIKLVRIKKKLSRKIT